MKSQATPPLTSIKTEPQLHVLSFHLPTTLLMNRVISGTHQDLEYKPCVFKVSCWLLLRFILQSSGEPQGLVQPQLGLWLGSGWLNSALPGYLVIAGVFWAQSCIIQTYTFLYFATPLHHPLSSHGFDGILAVWAASSFHLYSGRVITEHVVLSNFHNKIPAYISKSPKLAISSIV